MKVSEELFYFFVSQKQGECNYADLIISREEEAEVIRNDEICIW